MKGNKAFTLIELMIVISTLSLLASIIFANFHQGRVKAQEVKALQESKQLNTALQLYSSDYSNYPNSSGSVSNLESALVPQYISKIPEIEGSAKICSNIGITYKSYNGLAQDPDGGSPSTEFVYKCGPGKISTDEVVIYFPSNELLDPEEALHAVVKRWWIVHGETVGGPLTHSGDRYHNSMYFPQPDGTCLFAPVVKVVLGGNLRCISIKR